jgi:hypothetical protein
MEREAAGADQRPDDLAGERDEIEHVVHVHVRDHDRVQPVQQAAAP